MLMIVHQAWLERNQEKFGSRQVIELNIELCETRTFVFRSSLDMWCSLKQRLRSVSSGKEGSSCAELLASGSRFYCGRYKISKLCLSHCDALCLILVCEKSGLRCEWRGWMDCQPSFTAAKAESLIHPENWLSRSWTGQVLSQVVLFCIQFVSSCEALYSVPCLISCQILWSAFRRGCPLRAVY